MNLAEFEGRLVVSRLTLGPIPDRTAFSRLAQINRDFGTRLGIEINPHRLGTVAGYKELSRKFGVEIVGVHGPVYASYRDFYEKANLEFHNKNRKNALLQYVWLLGFGKTVDSLRRYASPFELAHSLDAYLAVHQETLVGFENTLLPQWREKVRILRENGWGKDHGIDNPLSHNPHIIREFADSHGIGTLLDTSQVLTSGYDLLTAYRIMEPSAIHLSDNKLATQEENVVPGRGDNSGELRELVAEVRHRMGIILTIETWAKPNLKSAIEDTLNFIAGGTTQSETIYSTPKASTDR